MKIKSMKIKNFRGYSDEIIVNFDDLTVIVGKNDVGKSTILEALDIFFNDGKGVIKIDKTDVNIAKSKNEEYETVISICFCDLPDKVVIDSSVETSLMDEYLLNENKELEIVKKFQNGGAAKVYIKASHPTNKSCEDLLLKKNSDLKKFVNCRMKLNTKTK